ncbi:MAG: carboxypeptidase-like regulatory domain-containing protein, partial [Acidobacteria bacterium]|nr:carboxypeptidase-like regulatory domain-containing protein [Acidobacteriota bacterium]
MKDWNNSPAKGYMRGFAKVVISLALLASTAVAQNISGTIQGTVKDSSGGVVSAATVTVTNEDTNIQYKAATGATGEYLALNLAPGKYTVMVASGGFKTSTTKGVRLLARGTARVDVVIQPGTVVETVEVRATVAAINSENATIGTTMEAATITALPLN